MTGTYSGFLIASPGLPTRPSPEDVSDGRSLRGFVVVGGVTGLVFLK